MYIKVFLIASTGNEYNAVKGEALEPNGSGKTVLKGTKDITIATAVQEKGQYLTKQNCSCKHGREL